MWTWENRKRSVLTGVHLKCVTFLQMFNSWHTHLLFQRLAAPHHVFVLYSAMFSSLAVIIHYKGLQSTVTSLHYDEVGLFELSQLNHPNVKRIHLCRCDAAECFSSMRRPFIFQSGAFAARGGSKDNNRTKKISLIGRLNRRAEIAREI